MKTPGARPPPTPRLDFPSLEERTMGIVNGLRIALALWGGIGLLVWLVTP